MSDILNVYFRLVKRRLEETGITKHHLSKTTKISDGYIFSLLSGEKTAPSFIISHRILVALGASMRIGAVPPAVMIAAKDRAEFGVEIKAARERAGLSINGLARKLGKRASTVAYWESGKGNPGIADVDELLRALNVAMMIGAQNDDNENV
jgi:transcriptional regulator with XRE-family HTH domain